MPAGFLNPKNNANSNSVRPAETDSGAGEPRWFDSVLRTRVWDQDLNRILAALRHPLATFGVTDEEGDDSLLTKVWQKFLQLTGGTMTGQLTISVPGGGANQFIVQGEGTVGSQSRRFSNDAQGAFVVLHKGRGMIASPSALIQNDTVGTLSFNGNDGSAWTVGIVTVQAVHASPSSTNNDGRLTFRLGGGGTTTEVARLDIATGLSMFGANPVIDQDRGHQLRSRTVSQLGSLTPTAGRMFFCSDETGGAVPVFGDGSSWRRVTDRNVIS